MNEGTHIFRVAMHDKRSVYRDIEIESTKSLYDLAEAITTAYDFDFDHEFGFYSGTTPATMRAQQPRYELGADAGGQAGARSVKQTPIGEAFTKAGQSLTLLYDFEHDWLFHVEMTRRSTKAANLRYPRLVGSKGSAPDQYPDPDDI